MSDLQNKNNMTTLQTLEREQAADAARLAPLRNLTPEEHERLALHRRQFELDQSRTLGARVLRWLFRLSPVVLLMLLLTISSADTYTYDQFGQINGHYPWPKDRDVWVFWPKINWSNPTMPTTPVPNYYPKATPSPTPCPAR